MQFPCQVLYLVAFFAAVSAQEVKHATILVHGTKIAAETDDNFICATLDWWPHDKCNYNQCPWGYSSAINMNLSRPLLSKAIQALRPLRIRIGGSLQDQVTYDVGTLKSPCRQFGKTKYGLFGYSNGCLHMKRWDELNRLFSATGAIVTFGLNALYGRHRIKQKAWGGAWDSSNARDFISYTNARGYPIDSWEFGNELSGSGIGASVHAEQYGKDLINLKSVINLVYANSRSKPSLVAPGGFFDHAWYTKLLQVSGPGVVNFMTHHIYNLGAGSDPNLVNKILDPQYLSKVNQTFANVKQTIEMHGPWAAAWVGESGGVYNSGSHGVSDAFVNSFWYLDQLGMASKFNTKVYCRQTLVGGNYGLLSKDTLIPNPDFYSALLWQRLMGKKVLAVDSNSSPFLRTYAHCSKGRAGITLLLINLSNNTDFIVSVQNSRNMNLHMEMQGMRGQTPVMHGLKKTVSWVGSKPSDIDSYREEYHLTATDGLLRSHTMVLNGVPVKLTDENDIPRLDPVRVRVGSVITVTHLSIAFIVFPKFDAPGCV